MTADARPIQKHRGGDRVSRISEACLRVIAETGLDEILQTAVDEARSITGAQYGVIELQAMPGLSPNIFTSGVSPRGDRTVGAAPPPPGPLDCADDTPEPPLLADNPEMGATPDASAVSEDGLARLERPITHWGETYGVIRLVGRYSGWEFGPEDEETLATLSSLAAVSITSARSYRTEHRAKADLEALINTTPVGVMVFDAQTGELHSTNEAVGRFIEDLRIPNLPWDQLISRLKYRRLDGIEISLEETPISQVLRSGETIRAEEVDIQLPGGKAVTALVNATPVRVEEDRVVSVVVTLQDAKPSEDAHRLGIELLGTVGQELRIPLTTIKGCAATVLSALPPLDANETRQFFRIIDQQADYMRELINNLLELSRIEAGTLTISPSASELTDMLYEAREVFLSSNASRNDIIIEQALNIPLVWADRQRVGQVLNSLLSMAAGYSRDSSPIRVTAGQEELFVAVAVEYPRSAVQSDGWPQQLNYHYGIRGEEEAQGHGPSFAVCRAIVESQGGRIWADVGERAGRFTFTLPVAESPSRDVTIGRTAENGPPEPERPRGMSILAIDKDPRMLVHLQNALQEAGYDPTVTSNLDEVDHLLELVQPQLVLLDLTLSGAEGAGMIERLPKTLDVPVIFLSDRGRGQDISRAFDLGGDDCIIKPFLPTELAARVKAALRKGAAYQQARVAEPYHVDDLTVDYTERRVMIAGQTVQLTATEYKLLFELSVSAGRVLTHGQLLKRVWGADYSGDARIVRAFVKSLRRKLGDDANQPRYIYTEPRVGYRMAKPSPQAGG